ncbi:NAD(P)-binding domain-containing protein [Bradyrhizobium sp. LB14.3]|uniref:NAD(P)-binding domain-containing protein n=1 Tax=Bradyrhizobium sp. LB14.3 TaxID=3156328 RepID=UPI0033968C5F
MESVLLRHGTELHVKVNRTHVGAERLTGLGAHEHTAVSELARHVSAVVLSLPASCEVEEVCLGQDGLFANLPRQSLIHHVLSCFHPHFSRTGQKACIALHRCPVTRPPEQAEQGASTPSLDRIRTRFLSRLAFLPHLREHRPCG